MGGVCFYCNDVNVLPFLNLPFFFVGLVFVVQVIKVQIGWDSVLAVIFWKVKKNVFWRPLVEIDIDKEEEEVEENMDDTLVVQKRSYPSLTRKW